MPVGLLFGVRPTENSVTCPGVGLIRAIVPAPVGFLNQRLPSEPAVISAGSPSVTYSVTTPRGVIRATLRPFGSVNHRFPSGPAVTPCVGELTPAVNAEIIPLKVLRPTPSGLPVAANQRFPSGPAVIALGARSLVGISSSLIVGAAAAAVEDASVSARARAAADPRGR